MREDELPQEHLDTPLEQDGPTLWDDPPPPTLSEAQSRLIEASGHVAEAASSLFAFLQAAGGGYECRCCRQRGEHDARWPCGRLHDALAQLGPAVQALTSDELAQRRAAYLAERKAAR